MSNSASIKPSDLGDRPQSERNPVAKGKSCSFCAVLSPKLCADHEPKPTPDKLLEKAAEKFRERDKTYGNVYQSFGKIMKGYFPDGIHAETEEQMRDLYLFFLLILKTARFAQSGFKHEDSIQDACVYAAMIESLL